MNASFEKLCRRNGAYNLPWLIYLHDQANNIQMRFVNNTSNIVYDENTYQAGCFKYSSTAGEHGFSGGGTLEISVVGNSVIDLIETYRAIKLEVIGTLCEDGTVTAIKTFSHHYGKVKVSRTKASFTFEKDDRLTMTFPALVWNSFNNRGNS